LFAGGFWLPHEGQVRASGVPQLPQNREFGGFSDAQAGQVIIVL
jgi:hypothetical protein